LPSGQPLPEALCAEKVVECGGVQVLEPGDFDAFDHAWVLLADNGSTPVEAIDFGTRDLVTIAVTPIATVQDTLASIPSAEVLIRDGIDLVILAGGPITGGAPAGVLVGKSEYIERITAHNRWKSLQASDAVAAMTLSALAGAASNPLRSLIETGEENLRSRAERLATRLTAEDAVQSCHITDRPARLETGSRWTFPSRQLCLRHKTLAPDHWADRLRDAEPSLITSTDEDSLVVDLRWIPPNADAAVGDAFCGHRGGEPEAGFDGQVAGGASASPTDTDSTSPDGAGSSRGGNS